MHRRIVTVLALVTLALSPRVSMAFPDLIRKGYQTCFGCHTSPAGGGSINDYGRLVSVELATWGGEKEARNLWGLTETISDPVTGWLGQGLTLRLHGDTRYLSYSAKSAEFQKKDEFLMQQEVEAVLDYKNSFGLAYSVGKYYRREELESRKAYVYANAGNKIRMRFGRFMPAYGLMLDDHTAYIRQSLGFNQGNETVNAEVSLYFKWIELFWTERIGREPRFIFDRQQGIRGLDDKNDPTDIDRASIIRLSVYPTGSLTLGASLLLPKNKQTGEPMRYGAFTQWAFAKKMYLMAEYDISHPEDSETKDTSVYFGRMGYELFKGMVARLDYNALETPPVQSQKKIAGSLAWIPRPHFELQFEASQVSVKNVSNQRVYQFMYHLWL